MPQRKLAEADETNAGRQAKATAKRNDMATVLPVGAASIVGTVSAGSNLPIRVTDASAIPLSEVATNSRPVLNLLRPILPKCDQPIADLEKGPTTPAAMLVTPFVCD